MRHESSTVVVLVGEVGEGLLAGSGSPDWQADGSYFRHLLAD